MDQPRFHSFLHKQIPVMMVLSILPGLGYVFLGYMHDIHVPALIWYALVCLLSVHGWRLYRHFKPQSMSQRALDEWYRGLEWFFYAFFALWLVIFLIYVWEDAYKLHYIAVFTEIGASVVAATLLYPDRRLFRPVLLALMLPLAIYFALIGQWYGYILSAFAATLTWVLFYAAGSSHRLLIRTHHQASHDQLTGLYNRHFFIDHMQRQLNSLRESRGCSFLLLIDLDHFKTVNDSLGHDVGDRLLEEVTARLQPLLRGQGLMARLGGDEFIIIGDEMQSPDRCQERSRTLAERLLAVLKETYVINDHHIYISASIGISLIHGDRANGDSANSLIREADIAMYEAKAGGRDGVFLFNEEMSRRVESHLEIERLLHFALEKDEISLQFQPQLDAGRRVIGAETLVRWNNDKLGMVPPDQFIPIAEQTGLIVELGNHILRQAFDTLRDWHERGIVLEQFSINISMRQFTHHSFLDTVEDLCTRQLTPELRRRLVFEVTESVVAEDIQRVIAGMRRLQQLGIRFSMDDFGTGYSSLSYLKQLPIDEVKIDRAFVRRLDTDSGDQAMVTTILNIAEIFGPPVVAEGVESEAQFNMLVELGCRIFQGYHFSRPLPKSDFEAFFQANLQQNQ